MLPSNVHTVPVIICECCPILLPIDDVTAALVAARRRGVTLVGARGCGFSCMEHETTTAVAEDERVVTLTPAAAVVLAEIVRGYRRAHGLGLGRIRETDLGDLSDEHGPAGVRGVHPHEHRRSAVA